METSKIYIPKAEIFKTKSADDAIMLDDFLREETDSKDILWIKKQLWQVINKSKDEISKRYNLFYGTLLRCWKVYLDGEHMAYMYPYELNEANKYLFCLYSPTDHINNHYIPNGLYEKSFDTTEWCVKSDIVLE